MPTSSDDDAFLEVAAVLGCQIVDSAIWHEGRCNWTGADPAASARHRAHAALGPHLYDGTSGVALFLAEAAVQLGDDRMRATAVGAIRHALHHAGDPEADPHDGLYTGPIGIAYAAAHVGCLLGAEPALAGAREILVAWRRHGGPSAASDVLGGCAGAAAGLVALAPLVDEDWVVEAAAALGEELLARAIVSRSGWTWPRPGQRSMHPLCGFSHGAAGIGYALIELFAATGDERFRLAGERAFDYERSWVQPQTGSWPDLRGVARAARRDAPVPAARSWCNGAPGIALSRIRAAQLLGADLHDAERAVAATRRVVSELLTDGPVDFCLCHGAAGAADVLLYARDQSGLAAEVGLLGMDRHHRPGVSFPCGLPDGETPGLLLGLAGIAMFYLRLAERCVPSPLLIHRRIRLTPPRGARSVLVE